MRRYSRLGITGLVLAAIMFAWTIQPVHAGLKRGDVNDRALIDVQDELGLNDGGKYYWICRDGMTFMYVVPDTAVRSVEGLNSSDPLPARIDVRIRAVNGGGTPLGNEQGFSIDQGYTYTYKYREPFMQPGKYHNAKSSYDREYELSWRGLIHTAGILDADGLLPAGKPLSNYFKLQFSKDFTTSSFSPYDPLLASVPDKGGNGYSPPVLDCLVQPLPISVDLVQVESNSVERTASKELVFEVSAVYGSGNIDGIESLEMSIIDPTGKEVHSTTETRAAYCAFGGNTCRTWRFAENNNLWPDGTPIMNGQHTLQVNVDAAYGQTRRWTARVDVQLPLYTDFIQTAPGKDADIITDALVFELGAHTGVGNENGYGISQVHMQILDGAGKVAFERTELNADYCAFGGNNCRTWEFAENNYRWPNGTPISAGTHTLRAIVETSDGRVVSTSKDIQIISDVFLPFMTR